MNEINNNEIPPGTWCWCARCGKCYKKGEYRLKRMKKNSPDYKFAVNIGIEPVRYLCPYDNCDGDADSDCYKWSENLPGMPKVPERNKVYHL
jgi:hypothetical protein